MKEKAKMSEYSETELEVTKRGTKRKRSDRMKHNKEREKEVMKERENEKEKDDERKKRDKIKSSEGENHSKEAKSFRGTQGLVTKVTEIEK